MEILKIKICKNCGIDSNTNSFKKTRYTCTKCLSSKNNLKLNEKKYYDNYYIENREKVLLQQRQAYHIKKELLKEENKNSLLNL